MIDIDLINGIGCFHRTFADFVTGANPPYHRHEDTYEIYLYIKGNLKMYVEQHCFIPSPGTLVLVRPNELHRCLVLDNSPYERIVINVNRECLNALSSEHSNLLTCFHPASQNTFRITQISPSTLTKFVTYTDDFLRYQQSDIWGKDLLAATCIIRLLVLINQCFLSCKGEKFNNIMPEIVIETMRYIEAHLTDGITLSGIAEKLNYSSNYLSKQFKIHTGLTLREYIFDKKIEAAKSALQEGMSVSNACTTAGFNDYANFIRSFTKKTGISPGRYRAEHD